VYWVGPGARSAAVRQGDWKLIVYRGGKTPDELFDLGRDPYEHEKLASRQPERVAELKQVLAGLAARDNDALVPEEK
jgi:arylsulfatase A-like enzyme